MADVDAVVVGAGVIGLAVARELALAGLSTVIIEQEDHVGTATSSRSSEVIHAGLYYTGLPLKQALCVAGRELLYRYCEERNVGHRRLGKLIVAFSPDEEATLSRIHEDARAAGVHDLQFLTGVQARQLEPVLDCAAALLSPSTGIIDSHAFMQALLADAEAEGAQLARRTSVTRLTPTSDGWEVHIAGETGPVLTATHLVNAAGHGACALAATIDGLDPSLVPTAHYARGTYFVYHGAVPFTRLIYPVPVPGGLGTHLTLDLAGSARFGPDVEWISGLDYSLDEGRRDDFATAARRIWPGLDPERLAPGYCGIRPKLGGPGTPASDFVIHDPADHQLPGMVGLYGIESPGITASLALAREVVGRLGIQPA